MLFRSVATFLAALPVRAGAKRFLCCDYPGGQVCIVSAQGEIEWRATAKNPQDCWLLPNGNVLFCHLNGAVEMTRENKIVWEYKAPEKIECHACQPLPDGRHLFAHQRAAVRWLLARRGAVLADAMGLGKTLTALVAARALVREAACRIVVVAPSGLHAHWRQEAAALQLRLELLSWAQLPTDLPEAGTVLIADEAHYAQNISSQRTRAFLRLSRHPRLRVAWLLTGTPMKNGRPAQLFPLLAAIGHPLAHDQRAFEERYCHGQIGRAHV